MAGSTLMFGALPSHRHSRLMRATNTANVSYASPSPELTIDMRGDESSNYQLNYAVASLHYELPYQSWEPSEGEV